MKKSYLSILLLTLTVIVSSCLKDRNFPSIDTIFKQPGLPDLGARTMIHYWSFNNVSALTAPSFSIGGAALEYNGATYDDVSPGSLLNARNADAEGAGLRLRNPAGDFILSLPTTNYKDLILTFATQRSSSGAQQNTFYYSIDGINFISDSLQPNMLRNDTIWNAYYIDFSSIKRVNNNPNFKIKIEFSIGQDGTSGNDRYDNITLDANIIDPVVATPQIIHYWNFNDPSSLTTLITPTSSIGGSSLAYIGTYDDYSTGSTINARNGDVAGSALRLRNPAGTFTLSVPTTNYKNIVLTLVVQRSNAGAQTNTISYSIDGTMFSSTGIPAPDFSPALDPDYQFVMYDLSAIAAINNNSNFKINIDFSNGSTGSSGNNRFDNIVIEGVHL
jgi:hypothetical protein